MHSWHMASTPAYNSVKNDHACLCDMSPASTYVVDGGEVGVLDLQAPAIARKDWQLLILGGDAGDGDDD